MVPNDRKYTKEHEWVQIEDGVATIGVTDFAAGELGDIVFVEMPEVGDEMNAECRACSGCGFVNEMTYRATPRDLK